MESKPKYSNEAYRDIIIEFFGDAFYLPGQSYGTKVQKIRQYTEIILRRMLKYPCDKNIELGNDRTIRNLNSLKYTEPLFRNALETIRSTGNERSHTKYRRVATEEEYMKILNSLFDIYGYLFYKFFKTYTFGSNPQIVSAFSLLPPIIRHITLTALYDGNRNDPSVIIKLVLAKLKAYNKEIADTWVDEHKDALQVIQIGKNIDSEYLKQLITIVGPEAAASAVAQMTKNLYDVCKEKIQVLSTSLDDKPLYSDFESAKAYYEQYGIVSGDSKDVAEFNDLTEFVYIGRRVKEPEIEKIPEENYIISQIGIFITP